jgi:hypothetical protein
MTSTDKHLGGFKPFSGSGKQDSYFRGAQVPFCKHLSREKSLYMKEICQL